MLVHTRLAGHKSASLFLKPITDDQAPEYSTIVKRLEFGKLLFGWYVKCFSTNDHIF